MRKERKLYILITLISLIVSVSVIICTFSLTNKKASADVDYSSEFYFSSGASVGNSSEALGNMIFRLYVTENLLNKASSINASIVQGSNYFNLSKTSLVASDAITASDGVKYFSVLAVAKNFNYYACIEDVQVAATITTSDGVYTATSNSRSLRQVWQAIDSAGALDDMFTDDVARLNVRNFLTVYNNDYATLAKSLSFSSTGSEQVIISDFDEDIFYRVTATNAQFFGAEMFDDTNVMELYILDGLLLVDLTNNPSYEFYELRNAVTMFRYEAYTYFKIENSSVLKNWYNCEISLTTGGAQIYTAAIPDLDAYTQGLKDAAAEAKQKQEEAEQALAAAEANLSSLQSEMILLEAEVTALEEELSNVTEENERLHEIKATLESEVAALEEDIKNNEQTIANYKSQISYYVTQIAELEAEIEETKLELGADKLDLYNRLKSAEEKNATFQKEVDALKLENSDLKKKLEEEKASKSGGCGALVEVPAILCALTLIAFLGIKKNESKK